MIWIDNNIGIFTGITEYTIFRIENDGTLRISGDGWKKKAWSRPCKLDSLEGAKRIVEIISENFLKEESNE